MDYTEINSTERNKDTIITINNDDKNVNVNQKEPEKKRKISKLWICVIILIILILGIIAVFAFYFGSYYRATANALKYMESTDEVTVTEQKSAYFFDGPGTEKALVFYQGAKVEEEAYAEILFNLAKNGIDCYLVKMPFNFAIFGKNKASKIIEENKDSYNKWYIAGHSLGGAMAAIYAANHPELEGLALLAAYPTEKISENMKVVSLLGSNDNVIQQDNYNKNIVNFPSNYTEVIINGGNHGQFGDYGFQKGDGTPTIALQEQHNIVVESIIEKFQ